MESHSTQAAIVTVAATEARTVTINTEAACLNSDCFAMAKKLHDQLSNGYSRAASILPMPGSIEEWDAEHRTARKRAAACVRDGYRFAEVERHFYADDVHEINNSAERRQGRPMTAGYHARPNYSQLPDYPCQRHAVHTYGVLDSSDRLRAYTWTYRCGDLFMFSMILGHHAHLERHVMYLLVRSAIEAQADGGGFGFYNLDASGTDGLRFFKHRCGFLPADIDWQLA